MRKIWIPLSICLTLGMVLLLAFQNCGTRFQVQDPSFEAFDSVAIVEACQAGEKRACSGMLGEISEQLCEANLKWGSCYFLGCTEGYFRQGNTCIPQLCTPNSQQNCTVEGGSGIQNCNAEGSVWQGCIAQSCSGGYLLVDGHCESQTCTPKSKTACTYENGVGQKKCANDGQSYGACELVSCNDGFYRSGNSCVQNVCAPDQEVSCNVTGGLGVQRCNSQGSALGACQAVSCDSSHLLQNGQCIALLCQPNSAQSCNWSNGIGEAICSSNGMSYGSCKLKSCNTGYYQSGSSCVKQACTPNQQRSCSVTGGSGSQTCNAIGSQWNPCTATSCNTNYHLEQGQCVSTLLCSPGQKTACAYPNGNGQKTCASDGKSYGSCQLQSCQSGYTQSGSNCVAQVCEPNSSWSCNVNNGTGSQQCNSQGSAFGACQASQCNSGYEISGNSCVRQLNCQPQSTRSCTVSNGSGKQTCFSDGSDWGSCTVSSCNSPYVKQNNSCVLQQICSPSSQQSCSVSNGSGKQTCRSDGMGWGSCENIQCQNGYIYNANNGKCETAPQAGGVGPVDPSYPVDHSFYKKQLLVRGFPILGSSQVSDQAFYQARSILEGMFSSADPEIWNAIRTPSAGFARLVIIGKNEYIYTAIPEYRHLSLDPLNTKPRGLGGVWGNPLTSASEETILCLNPNPYGQTSVMIHEMGHHVHNVALRVWKNHLPNEINSAFNQAKSSGLWSNTYSLSNDMEFFGQGVGAWFDGLPSYFPRAGNGTYNDIWNRSKIKAYDPRLSGILSEVFGDGSYRVSPRCP